ncbi:MAG: TMEM165/GDT1 family protein, partial [Acidobacteriota bacterium]|nr:TMEM165/GDT1 family protein [Acidobacteriota bacterium]
MDWRVFLTTFGVIFLAEMGDKTQLAAMTMAAQSKRPWTVFIGSALALTAVSAIGVVVGSVVGNYIPLIWIKRAAAV